MIVTFRDGPYDGRTMAVEGNPPEIKVPVMTGLPDYYTADPEATVPYDVAIYRKTKIAHGGIVVFQFTG